MKKPTYTQYNFFDSPEIFKVFSFVFNNEGLIKNIANKLKESQVTATTKLKVLQYYKAVDYELDKKDNKTKKFYVNSEGLYNTYIDYLISKVMDLPDEEIQEIIDSKEVITVIGKKPDRFDILPKVVALFELSKNNPFLKQEFHYFIWKQLPRKNSFSSFKELFDYFSISIMLMEKEISTYFLISRLHKTKIKIAGNLRLTEKVSTELADNYLNLDTTTESQQKLLKQILNTTEEFSRMLTVFFFKEKILNPRTAIKDALKGN